MNTAQLKCFLAIAENLNFARAAELLNVTQPAVTHQINALENELGVKLFRRTTRSVEMTEAGFSFLSDARDILGMTQAAKARLSNHSEDEILPFLIGCPGPLVYSLMPGPLKQLSLLLPQIHPMIKLMNYQLLQSRLQDESLHIMFSFLEESSRKKPGTFIPLEKAPAVCVTIPESPLAQKERLVPDDLKTGKMVVCHPHSASPAINSISASFLNSRPASDLYFCENQTCAFTMIKAGFGFAILPDITPVRDPELHYLPVKGLPSLTFGLYYKNLKIHPAIKDFIQIMKQEFECI